MLDDRRLAQPLIVVEHLQHSVSTVGKRDTGQPTEPQEANTVSAASRPLFHLQGTYADPVNIQAVIQQVQLVLLVRMAMAQKSVGIPPHEAGAQRYLILWPEITAAATPHQTTDASLSHHR